MIARFNDRSTSLFSRGGIAMWPHLRWNWRWSLFHCLCRLRMRSRAQLTRSTRLPIRCWWLIIWMKGNNVKSWNIIQWTWDNVEIWDLAESTASFHNELVGKVSGMIVYDSSYSSYLEIRWDLLFKFQPFESILKAIIVNWTSGNCMP